MVDFANGLLAGAARGGTDGYLASLAQSYRDWYRTQTQDGPRAGERFHSWLAALPEMYFARAPGNTCLSAIEQGANGTVQHPINRSKGCGGVMRVAPIGLYFGSEKCPPEAADRLGAEAAALTHGHELGYLPAAALVHIVRLLSHNAEQTIGSAVRDAMEEMKKLFPHAESMAAFQTLMKKAVELSTQGLDDLFDDRQGNERDAAWKRKYLG